MQKNSLRYKISVLTLSFLTITIVHAKKPVWTFTPLTATSILIQPNNTATVQYNVTNQSRKTHTLVMTPIPGITQITAVGTCTSPFTLAYQQSCVLSLQINSNELQGEVNGGPTVCQDGNSLQCYQPSAPDILHIQIAAAPPITQSLFAYVTNGFSSGANNVTRCEVVANGDFTNCTTSGTNLSNPTGIVINLVGTLAYITNLDNQDVSKCSLDINGDLINCTNSGTNLTSPAGIVLNASETYAYIANAGADNVAKCQFDSSGDLINCVVSGTGLAFPIGITINPAGTLVYLTNFSTNDVTKCSFDVSGDLTNCSNSGTGLQTPTGVVINSAGTFIYIVNSATTNVSKCQFDGGGDLINCMIAGGTTLNEPRFITFNADETFAYIANALGSNVTKCAIDGAGDLINCITTGNNMNGSTGIQLLSSN